MMEKNVQFCPHCNKAIRVDANFCPICGEALTEEARILEQQKQVNAKFEFISDFIPKVEDQKTLKLLNEAVLKLKK